MPLYEYRCSACGEEFECLVLSPAKPVRCPACDAGEPVKLVSSVGGISSGCSTTTGGFT